MKDFKQVSIFDALGRELDTTKDIIPADEISPIEFRAFIKRDSNNSGGSDWDFTTGQHGRNMSVYQIYGVYARLSDTVLYIKDFMTYPHLLVFDSESKASKTYSEFVQRAESKVEAEDNWMYWEIDNHPPFEDMHKIHDISNNMWAYSCREYADKVNYGYMHKSQIRRAMRNYRINYVDGHDMRYKSFETKAESEEKEG